MKRFLIIVIVVILALGVHSCVAVRNVYDEMYYGHSDVGPFWLTWASYNRFGVLDIPNSLRYMLDNEIIEYAERNLFNDGEDLIFEWMPKEKQLKFSYTYSSDTMDYVFDVAYSTRDHTLRYMQLRVFSGKDLLYDNAESFLREEKIERASIEEVLSDFFTRLINRWLEVNGARSRFTIDNIGEVTIENHLWDNSDPVE